MQASDPMTEAAVEARGGRRRSRPAEAASQPPRSEAYRRLRNPFTPQPVFTDDQIQAIHETALRVLEELGLKVLLPEARQLFATAGAIVDEDSQMARIGRDIVEAALATAPRSFEARAGDRSRDVLLETGTLSFIAGSGTPNAIGSANISLPTNKNQ